MFSRIFKSKKDKKDKAISLVVENPPPQEPFAVKVPKSLLMEHSLVFRKMAEHGGQFKKTKEIRLKGVTVTGVQKMLEYIQTDSVFFQNHFEVIETLKAAYVYQVAAVNDVCSNFLITVTERANVCDIYEFAASYSLHQVEYHCLKFIDRHISDVLKSPAFLNLKKLTVADIVRRQTLDVRSEVEVFRAVLIWGLNDCVRRGADSERSEEVLISVRPLLDHVRFAAMTDQELADPEVDKYYKILCAEESASSKRRSVLMRSESTNTRSSNSDLSNVQLQQVARQYSPNYVYELEILGSDEHSVRNGETFCLRVEMLKGRVFLTGVTLAFDRFVDSRGNSCLYVALSVTNVQTADQVSTRGTFMISGEEAEIQFPCPVMARDSEGVELALHVKRAINICSVLIKGDSQIAVPERKDVAMKIVPSSAATGGRGERSMFKGIKYFY